MEPLLPFCEGYHDVANQQAECRDNPGKVPPCCSPKRDSPTIMVSDNDAQRHFSMCMYCSTCPLLFLLDTEKPRNDMWRCYTYKIISYISKVCQLLRGMQCCQCPDRLLGVILSVAKNLDCYADLCQHHVGTDLQVCPLISGYGACRPSAESFTL